MKITVFIAMALVSSVFGILSMSCAAETPSHNPQADQASVTWVNDSVAVAGEVPEGWSEVSLESPGLFFHHPEAPGHVLSIQRLTENLGRHPLRSLKDAIKKHPYFSDFTYEMKWAEPIQDIWSPAFHASYIYLDAPAVRHGQLVASHDGYYEIAYHAPGQLHPEGLSGYERLLASISIIQQD